MKAKEKAEELRKKYLFLFQDSTYLFTVGSNIGLLAQQSAIIACDELIKYLSSSAGNLTNLQESQSPHLKRYGL